MKKRDISKNNIISIGGRLIIVAIVFFAIGIIIGVYTNSSQSTYTRKSENVDFINLYNDIKNDYYNEINNDLDDKLISTMIDELNDINGEIYEGKDAVNYKDTINNQYIGIGAEVTLCDGNIVFANIFEDSPANDIGLEKGDILLKVDGVDVSDMSVNDAVSLIKDGDENDIVELTIERDSETIVYNVKKSNISKETVKVVYLNDDIARVSINSFVDSTYQELVDKLDEIRDKDISKIALDLRNNYFGSIDVARKIAELFLKKGQIIYQEETNNGMKNYIVEDSTNYDFEIVLVTNNSTIKSAEMFAYSLIDNLEVQVIGTETGGDSSIQKEYELKDKILLLTIGRWLSPNGIDVSEKGIPIDYVEEDDVNSKIIEVFSN